MVVYIIYHLPVVLVFSHDIIILPVFMVCFQSIMQESDDVTLNFGEEDELDHQKKIKYVYFTLYISYFLLRF